MKIVFWDVQHGHAAYLKTTNRHIVFELGTGSHESSGREFSPLLHLKDSYGVDQLDAVVITHPHGDHIYDVRHFDALSPRFFHRPSHLTDQDVRAGNTSEDSVYVEKYLELNHRYTQAVLPGDDPFRPENNGGVGIQVFTPYRCSRSNLNNHSLVTVLSHASLKILIPGDNESASWTELLENPSFRSAIRGTDVLLAPHHGREAGYSEALFECISPRITVVSDGAETDTSAVDRYSAKSQGWTVHKRSGGDEVRKCVTTRSDGVIVVECGMGENTRPYLSITVD